MDHFREVSVAMVLILGTLLSFDEMMVRFMGRSIKTHRIKGKPIGEGFKLFVLTTFRGFVLYFTPDGRTQKSGKNEFKPEKKQGKIESMVLYTINVIEQIREKQKERLSKHQQITRSNEGTPYDEPEMKNFCIAMDNYFTLPKLIKKLRDLGIGIVGTSRLPPLC